MTEAAENPRAVTGSNSLAVSGEDLKQFAERIERLQEEKAGIAGDIKDVFAELKGRGFDTKVMREVLRIRKQNQVERQEHQVTLKLYMEAMGMGVFE